MTARQETSSGTAEARSRPGQRRRTRAAILAATTALIADGTTPSVDEIAAAAEVSRRTVYLHFPTLDQLVLDATVGALSTATVEAALDQTAQVDDAPARVDALVRALTGSADTTLPLGRTIIALTVDAPPTTDGPPRGYRRIGWIEQAVEPLRDRVSREQLDRLVSALAVVVGWEAMVVLRDVRGLAAERETEVLRWAAGALVAAVLAEDAPQRDRATDDLGAARS